MEKKVLNSKVSIIDKDGFIYMMGRSNESKTHVTYLIKYLEDKYGADTSKLKSGISRKIYGYIFGKLGRFISFVALIAAAVLFFIMKSTVVGDLKETLVILAPVYIAGGCSAVAGLLTGYTLIA